MLQLHSLVSATVHVTYAGGVGVFLVQTIVLFSIALGSQGIGSCSGEVGVSALMSWLVSRWELLMHGFSQQSKQRTKV